MTSFYHTLSGLATWSASGLVAHGQLPGGEARAACPRSLLVPPLVHPPRCLPRIGQIASFGGTRGIEAAPAILVSPRPGGTSSVGEWD
jgi:hypothetical protein